MKILIIGGAGYVGSVLVPKLKSIGHDITVIDLLWFGNHLPSDIEVIKQDAFDLTVDDLVTFEQVIFLAGLSNDPMAEFSPKQNFISNASLPSYLAYISRIAGVKRFIFASSCSIYGFAEDKKYSETDHVFSTYPYGISKIQAEFVIKNLATDDFSTICLRKGTISGYSPRMRLDIVINAMFKSVMTENKIIVNNPNIWRPILGMEDAIQAYIHAINAPYEISGVFNIASENYQILTLAHEVSDAMKMCGSCNNIDIEIKNVKDFRNYKVNTKFSRYMLGINYSSTVKSIIQDLINNNSNFYDYQNKIYYNIEVWKQTEK